MKVLQFFFLVFYKNLKSYQECLKFDAKMSIVITKEGDK